MAATTGTGGLGHRPHLDGLRAVAVYLVVLFHAGLGWADGGFIGVDVFFVLSGYLVTNLLLKDLWGEPGRLGLRRFYARRARRLLPAALVVLAVTAVVYRSVASPVALDAALDSFRAAALYVANWHFVRASTDYFAADVSSNPVLHYWSLSIEEQFYLVWPVLLIGLTKLRRRLPEGEDIVRAIVLLLGIASAAWAFTLADSNLPRAYYGSDTRAYQLLAGALLAMTPRVSGAHTRVQVRRWAGLAVAGCLVGLGVLGSGVSTANPIVRGIAATVLTVALLALVERAAPSSIARRFLAAPGVTYLGRISYGTYLWHWPVIVVLALVFPVSPAATAAVAIVVATALAALSAQLLELPIRTSPRLDLRPVPVIAVGLVASLLVGLVLLPQISDLGGGSGTTTAAASSGSSTPDVSLDDLSTVDWAAWAKDKGQAQACIDQPIATCQIGPQTGPRVLLIGDSHGGAFRPAIEEMAARRGWALSLATVNGCSWQWGLVDATDPEGQQAGCFNAQSDIYERILPAIDPDLVILVERAVDDPNRSVKVTGATDNLDGLEVKELLRRTASRSLDALRDGGYPTILIQPIPVSPDGNALECLSSAETVAECRFLASTGRTPLEGYLSKRKDPDLHLVDVDRLVCPYFPICDPVVDGVVVKWDDTHLTATYAEAISEPLEAIFEETDALP